MSQRSFMSIISLLNIILAHALPARAAPADGAQTALVAPVCYQRIYNNYHIQDHQDAATMSLRPLLPSANRIVGARKTQIVVNALGNPTSDY